MEGGGAGTHPLRPQPGAIAFVLKGYPRLSETFIAQEILGLERRGLDIRIVALRRPTDPHVHPIHAEIAAPVHYLPEYLHDAPWRVIRAGLRALRLPRLRAAGAAWWSDLRRDPTRNRIRRFGQALVLAAELPAGVTALHAHFLHTPASVTRYAALLLDLSWSGSAHAKDIWTTPAWEQREKLADCRWLVTCTAVGARHLQALAPPGRVELLYHGLDLARFPPFARAAAARDGSDAADPVRLLAVGRAVEKKGFAVLLEALARLPARLAWRLEHVGAGPLLSALRAKAERLGLAPRLTWHGALPQDAVLARYRAADAFVLPCRIAADGDRDGLPNVLIEAQSQGLACVSTRVSAIPELIEDEVTGLLAPADDPAALARALERLISGPALRDRLAAAGCARVHAAFSHEAGLDRLAHRFGLAPAETVIAACASPSTPR